MKTFFRKTTWLINAFVFLSLFSFLFIKVSYLMRPLTDTNRRIVAGFYAEEKNTLDMVYIGGSSCYRYWAPMETWKLYGIASFNFAYDSMPADSTISAIKEVVKFQSPSLLVVDTRQFLLRDETVPEAFIRNYSDSVKYSSERLHFLTETVPAVLNENASRNIFDYVFDIAKYHGRWKELSAASWKYIGNEAEHPYKGYILNPATVELEKPELSAITEKEPLLPESDRLLNELIAYCSGEKLEILFISNTFQETELDRKMNNYLEYKFKNNGINFINMNKYYEDIGIDFSRDLYDKNHVNIFGAEKYTAFVGKFIKDNYVIPDRRKDSQYSSWGKDMELWQEAVAEVKVSINNIIEEQTLGN